MIISGIPVEDLTVPPMDEVSTVSSMYSSSSSRSKHIYKILKYIDYRIFQYAVFFTAQDL